jgi:carbonic anhydrase
LGEIFVVRTAGQVLEPTSIASIEYAVDHLQAPLLMILGHEKCGAVTAAITHEGQAQGNIGRLLGKIQPAIDRARKLQTAPEDMVETVTDLHLEELAKEVLQYSEIISEAVAEGRLRLVTAKYQISSGTVQIHTPDFQG